jgi:hypothetical protein
MEGESGHVQGADRHGHVQGADRQTDLPTDRPTARPLDRVAAPRRHVQPGWPTANGEENGGEKTNEQRRPGAGSRSKRKRPRWSGREPCKPRMSLRGEEVYCASRSNAFAVHSYALALPPLRECQTLWSAAARAAQYSVALGIGGSAAL